jgi:hypothetical protein
VDVIFSKTDFSAIVICIKRKESIRKTCVPKTGLTFQNIPFNDKHVTDFLGVGTLWRCGDGLFFEVSPLASDALLTMPHPLLENVLQTVDNFEISCLGAPFSRLEKPRNRMRRDLDCMRDFLMGFHRSSFFKPSTEFNSDLAWGGGETTNAH